ncbi:MAG TPA: baseplate J/gp47 family protein, partial [Longimicrobiales bacterium]
YGTRGGESHRFRKGADFVLDGNALVWPDGAELPDAGTVVQVNYFGPARPGPVTDIQTGSVVRTLAETVALEMAGLYAQMEAVYESAFIDTADGRSLDNVVALLGIERVRGGRATTQIEFTRQSGSVGDITIPAGTRVMDEKGDVEYATTEDATLPGEQKTIRVFARDLEANDPVAADTLIVLPVPIAGIVKVTNPAPAVIGTRDETDEELRTRAKSFLHGSERATVGALRQAVTKQAGGITAEVVEDATAPGLVSITPHAESVPPTLYQRLVTAVEQVRPAGVKVTIAVPQAPRKVNIELRLSTLKTLLEQDLRAAQDAVKGRITDYFNKLPAADAASINKLVGLALSVSGVDDVRILSAATEDGTSVLDREAGTIDVLDELQQRLPKVLGSLRIADPNLATTMLAAVTYPGGQAPPDANQIRAALEEAIAYLNDRNASEPTDAADSASRVISYGKLLLVTPLPGHIPGDLEAHDAAVAGGGAPLLPDAAAILPYRVSFVFTQATGAAARLTATAHTYALTPFERLTLGGAEIAAENGNA